MKKKLIRSGCIALLVFIFMTLLSTFTDVLESLENKSYDLRVNLFADTHKPSEDITVVVLDQDSLDWAQRELGWSWPWPRSAYGDIVSFFSDAEAHSVAFDVLYTEPSIYGPEDDAYFAKESEEYGFVLQTVFFSSQYGNQSHWPAEANVPTFTIEGFDESVLEERGVYQSKGLFPISPIAESSQSVANISSLIDSDGVIRRTRFFNIFDTLVVPSLPLASATARNTSEKKVQYDAKNHELHLLNMVIPADIDGAVNLRYRKSLDSYIPYTARDILESKYALDNGEEPLLDPSYFKDNYVFFCYYAPGLFDICVTPVSTTYPGCGVHITALDNLLQGDFIADLSLGVNLLILFIFSVLGVISFRKMYKTLVIFVPSVIVSLLALVSFGYIWGYNIPFVAPLMTFVEAYSITFLVSYNTEYKQKRFIRDTFKQYLSPVVIDQLIEQPERVKLGGELRTLSIFFSDIEGFTTISESLNPQQLTEFLNEYLTAMTDIILANGGTIDKYEGDAIIAFWNAPLDQENHALRAIESAVQCQNVLSEMDERLQQITGKPVRMRIGLNTGNAVVGNMGSSKRFDYTMIGDSVNLAARLEGLNKQFGTYSMCTEKTMLEAKQSGSALCFRELAKVVVVGKKEAIRVFEPMDSSIFLQNKEMFAVFNAALEEFYNGNSSESLKLFESIEKDDMPAHFYVLKCRKLLESNETHDGIWRAENK